MLNIEWNTTMQLNKVVRDTIYLSINLITNVAYNIMSLPLYKKLHQI